MIARARVMRVALLGAALALGGTALGARGQASLGAPSIVWVPEGAFTRGADSADIDFAVQLCQDEHDLTLADGCGHERFVGETPAERVYLRRFGLDRTEVTRLSYAQCVSAGVCAAPRVPDDDPLAGAPTFPVVGVDARQAATYCAFRGGRLPSEDEWEKGARGAADDRRFPWGRLYDGRLANHGRPVARPDDTDGHRGLAPVGLLAGLSPYGLADMAGNAWEWTSSGLRPRDRLQSSRPSDRDARRVLRGGSYLHPATSMRVTARSFLDESSARADVGLRCAYDPP